MSAWLDLTFPEIRWQVHPDWHKLLFDAQGLRLAQWREQGRLETLKQAPHRTIFRIHLPGQTVFLKHYPVHGLRSFLRQLLRPAKARGEFDKALAVAARGVPTIAPIAVGETSHRDSYLLTCGLENVEPLQSFIEQTLPALPLAAQHTLRLQLAETLADLLARMHDAGVLHHDLHAGNLLIQRNPAGSPRLYLIDLHTVRLGPTADWPTSRANLVMLNRWFVQRSSRADRRRFWKHYVRKRSLADLSAAEQQRAKELERATWDSCLQFWRNRDRRCVTTNRYFYRLKEGEQRGWATRDLPADVFRRFLAGPDAPFVREDCRTLKDSPSSTVAEFTLNLPAGPQAVIYKRFMVTKWSDPWLTLARATPALKSWINGHRFRECGLPTARPLAVIHRSRHGRTHECYLLTEKLSNAVELHRRLETLECVATADRRPHLRRLVDQTARLVRRLHERQLSHRDLKAANILVASSASGSAGASPSRPQLFFIDLVGVERWRRLPRSRRVQNLARLHASFHRHPWISRTDKLRFLRTYLAWGLHGKAGWKHWWRKVAQATQAKVLQNQQRGRPLA